MSGGRNLMIDDPNYLETSSVYIMPPRTLVAAILVGAVILAIPMAILINRFARRKE
jgi:hypothetical protein